NSFITRSNMYSSVRNLEILTSKTSVAILKMSRVSRISSHANWFKKHHNLSLPPYYLYDSIINLQLRAPFFTLRSVFD
ncbi:hypothetical protein KUCAC02_028430, partial [Chaenocephalus aceratus]